MRKQWTITYGNVTCNVERDMMCATQPKHDRLLFQWEDVKIDHFKPPSSTDVTKIKDTFYIE